MVEVNVVANYNGLAGDLCEKIKRKGVKVNGKNGGHGVYRVSYRGKTYKSFLLPANYGDIAGICITPEF